MTRCPLPIDWLDLLDGRPGVVTLAHLDECPSCRSVVGALSEIPSDPVDVSAIQLPGANQRTRPPFVAVEHGDPKFGQIWWLSPHGINARLPVLVLGFVDAEEPNEPLADVAPVWTDVDNATPADLLLAEQDSTTGLRWRVAFRRQTLVDQAHLETLAGTLAASGAALISDALGGCIPVNRSGPELESEHDPRLEADSWMDAILAAAAASLYKDTEPVSAAVPAQSVDVAVTDSGSGRVLLFEIKSRRESATRPHRLAAAQPALGKLVTEATLRDETTGVSVDAVLWFDYRTDEVRLEPVTVHGINRPVRLVVHATVLDEPFSVDTPLVSGEPVTLSAGAGISERDIEALEMHLR